MLERGRTNQELLEELSFLKNKIKKLEKSESQQKPTAMALHKIEHKYHQLAKDMPALICTFLPDSTLTYVNKAYCELFQKQPEDLVGQKFLDFLPDDGTRENVRRQYISLTPENPVKTYEHKVIVSDGTNQYHWHRWTDRAFFSDDGQISYFQSIGQDITKHKEADEAQRESEKRFRLITDTIEEVFWMADTGIQENFFISSGYERVWGRTLQSLKEDPQSFIAAAHPDDRARLMSVLEVKKTGQPFDHEYRIIRPDGSIRWIWDRGFPIEDDEGHVTRYVGVATDISERKWMEDALRNNEELYRTILQTAMDGFWITDIQGRLLGVNEAYCRKIGYSEQELLTMRVSDLEFTKTTGDIADRIQKIMEHGEDRFESQHCRKDGSIIDFEISVQYLPAGGGRVVGFLRDITVRKQAEEQLKSSLKEKEVLLKELQHRVKNNLLTISGILALQLERIKDMESKDIFITSLNRIKAMTRIHARLYQSDNYSLINFKGYIEELAWELSRSYGFPPENMITNVEDISIDINTAIPAGLIVNELVSNAMKHAFPSLGVEDKGTGDPYGDRKGRITITLKERPAPQPAFTGETRAENSEAPRSPLVILTVSD
ncbi:MAG: PAS domain S-box protein, partial [Syntrophus sp. (in: bacteria)]